RARAEKLYYASRRGGVSSPTPSLPPHCMADTLHDKLRASLGAGYSIERELGGGGMSRVFVATDTALGRTVVIKVVADGLLEGLSVDRFNAEVKVAERAQPANI